jgi:hypothetical protein
MASGPVFIRYSLSATAHDFESAGALTDSTGLPKRTLTEPVEKPK